MLDPTDLVALALHGRGPYVVQAAITSLHFDDAERRFLERQLAELGRDTRPARPLG